MADLALYDVALAVWLLLKYALYTCLALLVYMGVNPVKRWRYRHIPGPFGWPLIGNFVQISLDYMGFMKAMRIKHGRIFKVWFGTHPWIVVSCPDGARKMARLNHQDGFPNALLHEERYLIEHMAVFLKPDITWKVIKKAWDPALLHPVSLEGYGPLMHECAGDLMARLETLPAGEPVDILQDMRTFAMDVVGTAAFGIKFHDSTSGAEQLGLGGDFLRATSEQFMSSMDVEKSSIWILPMYIFPDASELTRRLAYLLPDAGHKQMVQAVQDIGEAARTILKVSGAQRATDEAAAAKGVAAAGEAGKGSRPSRVMPGSFAVRLEAYRDKHKDSVEISDNLLAAQVITFLLGGYETTANTLGWFIYCMSINPEAQQKLQQELDTVLGGRKPTLEDLPKLEYLAACIKESARLHPVAFGLARVFHGHALDPPKFELMGKRVPPGTKIMALVFDMHRDPQYWERPEEFLPERFLPEVGGTLAQRENPMFHFGMGARKCTGYKFAEQAMLLVGATVFQRYTLRRPPGMGPVLPKIGVTSSPKGGVEVLLHSRV